MMQIVGSIFRTNFLFLLLSLFGCVRISLIEAE